MYRGRDGRDVRTEAVTAALQDAMVITINGVKRRIDPAALIGTDLTNFLNICIEDNDEAGINVIRQVCKRSESVFRCLHTALQTLERSHVISHERARGIFDTALRPVIDPEIVPSGTIPQDTVDRVYNEVFELLSPLKTQSMEHIDGSGAPELRDPILARYLNITRPGSKELNETHINVRAAVMCAIADATCNIMHTEVLSCRVGWWGVYCAAYDAAIVGTILSGTAHQLGETSQPSTGTSFSGAAYRLD